MSLSYQDPILDERQSEKLEAINAPVGPIKLVEVERLVLSVAEYQGRKIKVPQLVRSLFSPSMLDAPMARFLSPKRFAPNKARLTAAVSRVDSLLQGVGVVRPISLGASHSDLLSSKSANFAGMPTMGSKRDDVSALSRAEQVWRGKCPPPCIIGHRGKDTTVARAVWMFPFEQHIIEGAFFLPLQKRLKAGLNFYASENAVYRRAKIRELASDPRWGSKLAIDYSSFDASISTHLIGVAFDLMRRHLQLTPKEDNVWARVQTYFTTSAFIDQHGRLVLGRRGGVPSGSMFTQMVDTLVNALVIEYAIPGKKKYLVYGDDSLVFLGLDVKEATRNLPDYAKAALELNITLNLGKSAVYTPRDRAIFLGHYDTVHGRPLEEVLTRLIFPERPYKGMGTAAADSIRVAQYLAESDETWSILLPVYFVLQARSRGYDPDVRSYADNVATGIRGVTLSNVNPRSLPGLLQHLVNENPDLGKGIFSARAAV